MFIAKLSTDKQLCLLLGDFSNQSQIQDFSQFDGSGSSLCVRVLGDENLSLNFCAGAVLDTNMLHEQGHLVSGGCDQPDPAVGTKVACLAVSN